MASTENSNNDYVSELMKEQQSLVSQNSIAYKLLQQEIERIRNSDTTSNEAQRRDNHIEVHTGKQFRLKVKVHIPVEEFPNFNFVGKLLGPKGSSLQQLQEATQTKMAIVGRGSMRDKRKEEELRSQRDPKYAHLNEDLHVEICALAPPPEAYRRMAAAIAEVQGFLVPENMQPFQQNQGFYGNQYPMGPMNDGKPKPPFAKDGPPLMPPRGGPPAPSRQMPPMMPVREPPRRPALSQSTYAAPEPEEWAAPRPASRRGGYMGNAAAAPRAPPARAYDEGADDYNSYGDSYGDYSAGANSSYYDYTGESDGAYPSNDYGEGQRAPVRNAGNPRGRGAGRMQAHPYAGAPRRGY